MGHRGPNHMGGKTQAYSSVGRRVDGTLLLGDIQACQPRSKQHPMPMAAACFWSIEGKRAADYFLKSPLFVINPQPVVNFKKKCICLAFDLPLLTHKCLALEHWRSVTVVMYVHTDSFSITNFECDEKKTADAKTGRGFLTHAASRCVMLLMLAHAASCRLILPHAAPCCLMLPHALSLCLSNQRD